MSGFKMLQALSLTASFAGGGSAESRCLRFAGHKQLHVDPARPLPRPGSQGRASNVRFAEGAANKPLPARCALGTCVLLAAGRTVAAPFRLPEARCETRRAHFFQGVTAQAGPQGPVLKSDSSSMIHPRKKLYALGQGGHWQRCPGDDTAKTRCPRPGVQMKMRVLVCNNDRARHATKTAQARPAAETTYRLPAGSEAKGWRRFCVCECGGHKGSPTSHSQISSGCHRNPMHVHMPSPKPKKLGGTFWMPATPRMLGHSPTARPECYTPSQSFQWPASLCRSHVPSGRQTAGENRGLCKPHQFQARGAPGSQSLAPKHRDAGAGVFRHFLHLRHRGLYISAHTAKTRTIGRHPKYLLVGIPQVHLHMCCAWSAGYRTFWMQSTAWNKECHLTGKLGGRSAQRLRLRRKAETPSTRNVPADACTIPLASFCFCGPPAPRKQRQHAATMYAAGAMASFPSHVCLAAPHRGNAKSC